MENKRERGFYWVKTEGGYEWVVARYYTNMFPKNNSGVGYWSLHGIDAKFFDIELSEINEQRIDEPTQ